MNEQMKMDEGMKAQATFGGVPVSLLVGSMGAAYMTAHLFSHPADRIFVGKKSRPDWKRWERELIELAADLGCRYRLVDFEGDPYLLRIYLHRRPKGRPERLRDRVRRRLPGVYLHCFLRSDADRELHSHPWRWALAILLAGGYHEQRRAATTDPATGLSRVSERLRRAFPLAGCFNVLREDDYHRVELLKDPSGAEKRCWTLFIAGPRVRQWGFWDARTGDVRPADDDRDDQDLEPGSG